MSAQGLLVPLDKTLLRLQSRVSALPTRAATLLPPPTPTAACLFPDHCDQRAGLGASGKLGDAAERSRSMTSENRFNARFAPKPSEQSMTGRGTRTLSIFRSSDGSACPTGHDTTVEMQMLAHAYSVASRIRMMVISRLTTALRANLALFTTVSSIARTIYGST